MQPSPTSSAPTTGELIANFRYGKGFLVFTVIFGIVMLGLAVFVLYLSTILPPDNTGPVSIHNNRGLTLSFSSPQMLMYGTSALLGLIGAGLFGVYVWHKKLRRPTYDVYENGIAYTNGEQKDFVPFSEIDDLYLFSSGQTVMTGLVTNLAFRRNVNEPFQRVIEPLKGFQEFQQMVRELHLRARLPKVLETLDVGGAVTFNYISTGQVWRKRMSGNFLDVTTLPIVVTKGFLEVQGRKVPMSTLRRIDLNAWTEKVVIKDEAGKVVMSSICTGILSHDLFLNTLDAILEVKEAERSQATSAA